MSPAVISITIVAYFIILFTISYIAGRKADNEGFFVGNRKSAWYVVAFAMIGSTISGVTFVSVPGMVQAGSFSYLQMVLGFIVGILFIIGLIASAYSAAGSALTALTTSFTVDILNAQKKGEAALSKIRKHVHIGMAVVMGAVIFVFNLLNNTSVIDAIYTLASYTYGPILGLFAFGIFTKKQVNDKYIPLAAIASPVLCYILQRNSEAWFNGYQISYELLIINALFTFLGLCLLIKRQGKETSDTTHATKQKVKQ